MIKAPRSNGSGRWLAVAAMVEAIVFVILCLAGRSLFVELVQTPDSAGYWQVAHAIVEGRGIPIDATRTVGYPLWLAFGLWIGGNGAAPYVVIGLQLILNLLFLRLFWSFQVIVAPQTSVRVRGVIAAAFFLAGLGMAIRIMTDFLSAFLLATFLHAFLLGGGRARQALGSAALAAAIVTRPTLNYVVVLLPLAFLAARELGSTPSWRRAVIACVAAAIGLGANSWQDLRSADERSMDTRTYNARVICEQHLDCGVNASKDSRASFEATLANMASRPYEELTRGERHALARSLMLSELGQDPIGFARSWATTFLKYLLVPIEGFAQTAFALTGQGSRYVLLARPILFAACMPLWLLCLWPPMRSGRTAYLVMVAGFTLYVIGLSALVPYAGERMRFPLLFILLPIASMNLTRVMRARTEPPDNAG